MLTISDYKNWAVQNRQTAVALNPGSGSLVAESTRVGALARAFKSGSVKDVRGAVVKDFTRALSARYGASIAQQAVAMAGLSPTSQLKGWKITRAIAAAKGLRAEMLQPATTQSLRLGGTDISRVLLGACLTDRANPVSKFLKQRTVAVQLLGEMPLGQAAFEDFSARAAALVVRLATIRSAALPEGIPPEDFRDAVNQLIAAVSSKVEQARELLARDPLGEANLNEYRDVWRNAAVDAMAGLANKAMADGNDAAAGAIVRAYTALCTDPDVQKRFNESVPRFAHGASKQFVAPFVANLVKQQFAKENVQGFKVGVSDLVRRIDEGFQNHLNERPWLVVDKSVSAAVGGRPVALRSTIAPAERLGRGNGNAPGPIASRYPQGVHGYMCDSSTANHAVNLSVTSVSVDEPGGPGSVAFTGVRHGVHSAWGIRNAEERHAANVNRAEEAVIAAFLAKFDGPGASPELPDPGEDGTTTVDLAMASVSLLTPGTARHTFKTGTAVDERRMLMDQSAAWDAVSRNGVEFQYKGRTIRIRPQILTFNFGVNEGAVNKLFKMAPDLAGGWDISARMNKAAFEALTKDVIAFANDKTKDGNARGAALALFNQCRNVLLLKNERKDAHDAFKIAARIAVLCNLIGKVPCWNCKSGKDRTGQMDVECKFLSTLIARGEKIPEPGAPLTKEQQSLLRAIALEGGNFEIQKMNTGIAGFKTGRIDSVTERLGGQEYRAFHRGGSDHVNV